MTSPEAVKEIRGADVYKQGILAAHLERHEGGTRFSYLPKYLSARGPAVAVSLPLTTDPVIHGHGAIPPYFAGLLPEGRRLSFVRQSIKTSADDEFSLLLAVGGDPVGNVQVIPKGSVPQDAAPVFVLDPKQPFSIDELLDSSGIDPSALAGVQDKVSAGMISLPVEASGRRFILKIDPPEYPHVVENEFLMYSYARRLKLPVSTVQLLHDDAGRAGLLVARFDRETNDDGGLRRLAVEDASQIMGLYPAQKYNVPFEHVAEELPRLCAAPLPALRNLALQLTFAWLAGNGDLHAKNVSLLQSARDRIAIAPIYDIPSTVVYGDNSLALPVGGKRTGISGKHLLGWMGDVGLPQRAAEGVILTALTATRTLIADLAGGAGPFATQQTRSWTRELKNRRRLIEPK